MAKKKRYCEVSGKIKYRTVRQAMKAAREMLFNGKGASRAYECSDCGEIHLTQKLESYDNPWVSRFKNSVAHVDEGSGCDRNL